MSSPKVSIITVCFNASETIQATIESVKSQTYQSIEQIFIDGGSSDNTVNKIKENANKSSIVISEKDNGIYSAMNKGIRIASGEIIGFLNADDTFTHQGVINEIVKAFNSDIDCVYGNLFFVNDTNKIVRKWNSREFKPGLFRFSWAPAHPTFYCRKSVYDKYGVYREDFLIASDVDLMFRFLEINRIPSFFLNKNLVKMKTGGVSTRSLKSTMIIIKEVFISFRENGYKYSHMIYLVGKLLKAIKQLT